MKKALAAAVSAALLFAANSAIAQDKSGAINLHELRDKARADKKQLVAQSLQLTPAEAKAFWPIYDAYQRKLDTLSRRHNRAVEEFIAADKNIKDSHARMLVNEDLAFDEAEAKLRRSYFNKLFKTLPARKAARYLQIEGKLKAVATADLAAATSYVQ